MSPEHKIRSRRRTKSDRVITAELCVDDVMRHWPATIRVFLHYRMHCIGCPLGRFHSIAEACREHNVDLGCFIADLRATVSATSKPDAT